MNEKIIENAIKYIEELFQDNTDGHDANHSLRVYNNAMNIAAEYSNCDITIVALAALLHDVDDHKLFHTQNNKNARYFLSSQDIEQEKIDIICNLIM
ncbi:MAG: HD domain-containing protein [Ruminococcus sp.]|nr:HD domain-containing protein [Ruminococcus sp.]